MEPSEIFKVLSVETRVKIIELLKARGPLGAKENCRHILNEVCTCGCRGTGKFKKVELERSNLESLREYEKALKNELHTVLQRVKELESTKK